MLIVGYFGTLLCVVDIPGKIPSSVASQVEAGRETPCILSCKGCSHVLIPRVSPSPDREELAQPMKYGCWGIYVMEAASLIFIMF